MGVTINSPACSRSSRAHTAQTGATTETSEDPVARLAGVGTEPDLDMGRGAPRGAFEPCCGERTQLLVRRSGLVEVDRSLIPGTWVRVASSGDKAGTRQHCQMVSGPANETGRCNDSESAYERLSRASHQLESDRSGLGCSAYPCERGTPGLVSVADREAMVKVYGVAVAMLQGQSWAPHPSNGLGVNVGTTRLAPSSARSQRADGKVCRQLMLAGWGGGVVVVRGRESRSHGEGPQCVRSINAERGGRW